MKPKTENPAIANETLLLTASLLSIPCTITKVTADDITNSEVLVVNRSVTETAPAAKVDATDVSFLVSPSRSVAFRVIKSKDEFHLFSVTKVGDKEVFALAVIAQDYSSALVAALFGAVSDVIASANEKALANFVATAEPEHKVLCENCHSLVLKSDFGSAACKSCEA